MTDNELVNEIFGYDPMLAEMVEERLDQARHNERNAYLKARIDRAEENLDAACRMAANDPTGQDGEEYAQTCARDLIDTRDDCLRHTDPEQWMERRMGC